MGLFVLDPEDDYPDYVVKLCRYVLKDDSVGIMICKTGGGVTIAANKFRGIYAASCWNDETAIQAKTHAERQCALHWRALSKPQACEEDGEGAGLSIPLREGGIPGGLIR